MSELGAYYAKTYNENFCVSEAVEEYDIDQILVLVDVAAIQNLNYTLEP